MDMQPLFNFPINSEENVSTRFLDLRRSDSLQLVMISKTYLADYI